MKSVMKLATGLLTAAVLCIPIAATAQDTPKQVLFTNVNVFDGFGPELKMDMSQRTANTWVVDGPDEVTKAVRLNLRRGASFIKVMGGGGVASEFDPLEIMGLAADEVARAMSGAFSAL